VSTLLSGDLLSHFPLLVSLHYLGKHEPQTFGLFSHAISELDTGRVDPQVGLGRVGSSDKICQKFAQFLSSVIFTVVLVGHLQCIH